MSIIDVIFYISFKTIDLKTIKNFFLKCVKTKPKKKILLLKATLVRLMFVFLIDVLMLNYVKFFKTRDINEYISKKGL
jgi:hypothetical protein